MPPLRVRVEFEGRRKIIGSIYLADGSNPAAEFLDAMDDGDRRKMDTLFEMMGQIGKIENREKFKKLTDDIYAFKSFQVRMPCFFGLGQKLYLLFGLIKKSDSYKPAEVKRAEEYRDWARGELGE